MAISTRSLTDHHGALIPHPAVQASGVPLAGAALEDAIRELVTLQSDHWISVITDGELARSGNADPVAEVKRLATLTDGRIKVRVPRASATTMIEASTLQALLDAGCTYIQLDGAAYAPLVKRGTRSDAAAADTLDRMLAADAAVLGQFNVDPAEVKIAVCCHDPADLSSRHFAEDLDLDVAARLLRGLKVNRFIFDCGSGTPDYGFLKLLPAYTQVALCLIDGNAEQLEDADDVLKRILPAADVVDTDRLALATRHGFYRRPGEDVQGAWVRQSRVLTLLLDASSRAWGIDF